MVSVFVLLLVAPVIGSFLGAMAVRIPDGRPVLFARSQCDSCGRVLAARVLPVVPWRDHAIGATAGFAALAVVAWLYRRLRNRDGLGLGDAKLSAAIGAWVAWQGLPTMLLWGSMLGLLFAIGMSVRGR